MFGGPRTMRVASLTCCAARLSGSQVETAVLGPEQGQGRQRSFAQKLFETDKIFLLLQA